jgi:hypothetical protein
LSEEVGADHLHLDTTEAGQPGPKTPGRLASPRPQAGHDRHDLRPKDVLSSDLVSIKHVAHALSDQQRLLFSMHRADHGHGSGGLTVIDLNTGSNEALPCSEQTAEGNPADPL